MRTLVMLALSLGLGGCFLAHGRGDAPPPRPDAGAPTRDAGSPPDPRPDASAPRLDAGPDVDGDVATRGRTCRWHVVEAGAPVEGLFVEWRLDRDGRLQWIDYAPSTAAEALVRLEARAWDDGGRVTRAESWQAIRPDAITVHERSYRPDGRPLMAWDQGPERDERTTWSWDGDTLREVVFEQLGAERWRASFRVDLASRSAEQRRVSPAGGDDDVATIRWNEDGTVRRVVRQRFADLSVDLIARYADGLVVEEEVTDPAGVRTWSVRQGELPDGTFEVLEVGAAGPTTGGLDWRTWWLPDGRVRVSWSREAAPPDDSYQELLGCVAEPHPRSTPRNADTELPWFQWAGAPIVVDPELPEPEIQPPRYEP
ncbi:MAG: hypothetical protein H6719_25020 [Sandaracinaceae bacterium]|nr:hypothetical protein [Sandaracinaceae bacterium]